MTPEDLIPLALSALGITHAQALYALLTVVSLAPVVSWLRPRVDPVLARWADRAALTRTEADDTTVRVLTAVWGVVVWLPAAALRVIPVFATQAEVDELAYQRRMARLLEERK